MQQNKPFPETSMFKSYFKVGSWTGLSRVFGLVRDITTTGLLGTSSGLHDIFVVVLKIPNVFRRFFAEGAFFKHLFQFTVNIKNINQQKRLRISSII